MTVPTLNVDGEIGSGAMLRLKGKQYHYLARVLRVRRGDPVRVASSDGTVFEATVSDVGPTQVTLHLGQGVREEPAATSLCLVASGLKRRGTESLVAYCAELGIDRVVLTNMRRTVALSEPDKLPRLSRVASEAARRVGQPHVTRIEFAPDLTAALTMIAPADAGTTSSPPARASGPALYFLWEKEGADPHTIDPGRQDVAFVVGPEGGFDPSETQLLSHAGAQPVLFRGPAYRAETAAFIGAVVFSFLTGRL